MNADSIVCCKNIGKTFTPEGKTVRALDGFSLEAQSGSFTVIVGKSGCGKTTFLKCVAGLEKPDDGEIVFGDAGKAAGVRSARGSAIPRLGIMFQDPRLLPWLTVEKNLALALPGERGGRGERARVNEKTIAEALELVGLAGWGKAYPAQLSGGMAQRASLARCLCRKPQLLLLDEPLSALDSFTRSKLRKELAELWRRLGLTVILVTHDIEEAVCLGDRVIVMEEGKAAAEYAVPLGRPRDYRDPAFQEMCVRIENEFA